MEDDEWDGWNLPESLMLALFPPWAEERATAAQWIRDLGHTLNTVHSNTSEMSEAYCLRCDMHWSWGAEGWQGTDVRCVGQPVGEG